MSVNGWLSERATRRLARQLQPLLPNEAIRQAIEIRTGRRPRKPVVIVRSAVTLADAVCIATMFFANSPASFLILLGAPVSTAYLWEFFFRRRRRVVAVTDNEIVIAGSSARLGRKFEYIEARLPRALVFGPLKRQWREIGDGDWFGPLYLTPDGQPSWVHRADRGLLKAADHDLLERHIPVLGTLTEPRWGPSSDRPAGSALRPPPPLPPASSTLATRRWQSAPTSQWAGDRRRRRAETGSVVRGR